MKEVVENLVVTDLQKYLEKPSTPLTGSSEMLADARHELSKKISFDMSR